MTDDFGRVITSFFRNDYRERGKVKWQGYFLSDHTSSLNYEAKQRHHVTKKLSRMSLNEIRTQLQWASANYMSVTLQLDFKDQTGQMYRNIVGLVAGFSDRGVVINGEQYLFENIRAVVIPDDNN